MRRLRRNLLVEEMSASRSGFTDWQCIGFLLLQIEIVKSTTNRLLLIVRGVKPYVDEWDY